MTVRRPLGETLGEIVGGALALGDGAAAMIRVTEIALDLPLDLRIEPGVVPVLIGDVPLFRTRTDFDWPPARITATFVAQQLGAQP